MRAPFASSPRIPRNILRFTVCWGFTYFSMVIQRLRDKYSLRSYDEGEFTFTGIDFRQWDDGSIEYDQHEFLERIQPAHVLKHRRNEPESPLFEEEQHELRRLNGNIQYAAAHTRPDLSANVGMLQSAIPKEQAITFLKQSLCCTRPRHILYP